MLGRETLEHLPTDFLSETFSVLLTVLRLPRRCTLENLLVEAACLACGASRLSSLGDIQPEPEPVQPRNLVNILQERLLEKIISMNINYFFNPCINI